MMIDKFLNYLRFERNYSERTLRSYGDDLRSFEAYFKDLDTPLSWQSASADVIRGWMESMMDKGNNATSINRRLSALRSFYRFALSRGLVKKDPAHGLTGPKKSKPLPQFMKESEMEQLLDKRMWRNTYKDVCVHTIISVFYETGIRVSELAGLDNGAVDLDGRQLKVTGKRNKQRIVPFGEELHKMLRNYMDVRDSEVAKMSDAFFVTAKGKRMTDGQIRYEVKKSLARVTTMKKRSPHVLRHTFATTMLNHEAGLESVKKLLGHQSLSTTEIYTHTTFEQLKKAYRKAHPRA